jgi:hypothetical protein
MTAPTSIMPSVGRARGVPLAACIASAFALSSPAAQALVVLSCTDNGVTDIGNLRNSIGNAAEGATIDLSQLACSEISLHNGQIVIAQNNLTIKGPGMTALAITGIHGGSRQPYRVFNHTGTGTLAVRDVRISDGYAVYSGNSFGGCIRSSGSVDLDHVQVTDCDAKAFGQGAGILAEGGGIHAANNFTLKHSVIANNVAGVADEAAFGGGFLVQNGSFKMYDSTVSGNHAGTSGSYGYSGGGSVGAGDVVISNSTIAGNTATARVGGLSVAGSSAVISNSTISGNIAVSGFVGGILLANVATVQIGNSTIAFNNAATATAAFSLYAPGVAVYAAGAGTSNVTVQSSVFSNNTFGSSQYDLSIKSGSSVAGANNLVHVTGSEVPAGTKLGALGCPLLGPLRDNGGPTLTHALASNSPAVDAGNNAAALTSDQRGAPFVRVSGTAADIGAYEADKSEVILAGGFEGCPG